MNTVFALIAIIMGGLGSLIAFNKVQLDRFISPDEAEEWHKKWGKIFKIISPIAAIFGIWLLLF
jgi:amino acid transporter